jgi:Na+-driven multidrug efflux pump
MNYPTFIELLLVSGLTARIAESRSKKKDEEKAEEIRQYILLGLGMALIYGTTTCAILLPLKDYLLRIVGTETAVKYGSGYYITQAIELPFDFFENALCGILFGLYDLPVHTFAFPLFL